MLDRVGLPFQAPMAPNGSAWVDPAEGKRQDSCSAKACLLASKQIPQKEDGDVLRFLLLFAPIVYILGRFQVKHHLPCGYQTGRSFSVSPNDNSWSNCALQIISLQPECVK